MLADAVDLSRPTVCQLLQQLHLAPLLVRADVAIAQRLLDLVGHVASVVADLDPPFLHALVDELDQVPATLLCERRDVEPHDGPVDVRRQADLALEDALLDRTERAPVPRLDDDGVRFGHADAGQLVERRLGAVVLDRDALDQRSCGAAGADRGQLTLERLDRAGHACVGVAADVVSHAAHHCR